MRRDAQEADPIVEESIQEWRRIQSAAVDLAERLGRKPTVEALARELGADPAHVCERVFGINPGNYVQWGTLEKFVIRPKVLGARPMPTAPKEMRPSRRREEIEAHRARIVGIIKAAAIAYAAKRGRKPTTVELEAEILDTAGELVPRRVIWRYAFDARECCRSDGIGELIKRRDIQGRDHIPGPAKSRECESRATNPPPHGLDRAAWDAWGEREVARMRRNVERIDPRAARLWRAGA